MLTSVNILSLANFLISEIALGAFLLKVIPCNLLCKLIVQSLAASVNFYLVPFYYESLPILILHYFYNKILFFLKSF